MTKEEKEVFIKVNNEILNDAFWLGFILEIKRKIKNYGTKELLSSFLLFFSSIFCDETIKANHGGLSGKRKITTRDINEYRMYNLKHIHNKNSENTKAIMKEMGIDFKNYIFDIYLHVSNDELLDINFRNWDTNKEDNFELYDGIVATPYRWIEILFPDLFPTVEEALKDIIDDYVLRFSSSNIERKSYSCYRMFGKTDTNDNDKLYILQKYGLVKTALFIERLLKTNISFEVGPFKIDSKKFWIKIKAIIIESFWDDNKKKNISVVQNIFKENELVIDPNFYSLNRKLRDNIHYKHIDIFNDNDYDYLEKYQNIYLTNVIKEFDKHLYILFDKKYKRDYKIAEFLYKI